MRAEVQELRARQDNDTDAVRASSARKRPAPTTQTTTQARHLAAASDDPALGQLPVDLTASPAHQQACSGSLTAPSLATEIHRRGRALALLVPLHAELEPATALASHLASAGLADAPRMFAEASGAAAVGVRPPPGSALEARFFIEHIKLLVDELLTAGQLTTDDLRDEHRPSSWDEAAATAGGLLAQASVAFRTQRRTDNTSSAWGGSALGSDATLEARRDRSPPDAYEEVPVASKHELQLAVSAELLHSVTAPATLAAEYQRPSVFKSFTTSSDTDRDQAMAGEALHFVSKYGQAASAFLVSNGRATAKTRGVGVPPALSGLRAHLLRRATTWVEEQYGMERAAADRDAAAKLALSMLCGAVPGDTDGKVAAEVIVRLLGGTKPHALAEVDEEGGSVTAGTWGTLQGEAAQSSIRTAFRLWALGVAQTFGVVFVAHACHRAQLSARPAPASRELLGAALDFGVDELLRQVPPLLPLPELLSLCHFLTTRVATVAMRHRQRPGADMADISEVVQFMNAEVVHSRLRDFRQVTRAAEQAARILGRQLPADAAPQAGAKPAQGGNGSTGKAKTNAGSAASSSNREAAGTSSSTTPQKAQPGPAPAEDQTDGLFLRRLPAVQAFQVEMRARLGLEPGRPHGADEPCAWRALTGKCKATNTCLSCNSTIPAPQDLVQSIIQRSKPGLFGQITGGSH